MRDGGQCVYCKLSTRQMAASTYAGCCAWHVAGNDVCGHACVAMGSSAVCSVCCVCVKTCMHMFRVYTYIHTHMEVYSNVYVRAELYVCTYTLSLIARYLHTNPHKYAHEYQHKN